MNPLLACMYVCVLKGGVERAALLEEEAELMAALNITVGEVEHSANRNQRNPDPRLDSPMLAYKLISKQTCSVVANPAHRRSPVRRRQRQQQQMAAAAAAQRRRRQSAS